MNKTLPRAFFVTVVCAACGLAAIAQEAAPPNPNPARFEAEIAAFENWDRQNAFPRDAVLFVGSSSIRLWPTAESFPDLPVINRGFGGSHISDVIHFADRIVLKYKPRAIVFYAGDNDIADGKSPQQVFDDFQAFARLVQERLPDTRIVYLPIKPSPSRWKLWREMQDANARVAKIADANDRLVYVDTATPMLGQNGRPRRQLFLDDELHMNPKGYKLWTKTLTPVLQRMRSPSE